MTDTRLAWAAGQTLLAALGVVNNPGFEAKHPRGGDGQFIPKPDGHSPAWVKLFDVTAGLWVKAQVEDLGDGQQIKIKRLDNNQEVMVSRKTLFQTDQPKATLDPSGWKNVGGQLGSNPGGTYTDPSGAKWYVKQPKSVLHAENEDLSNQLYRAAGVPTPQTAVSPDGKRFLTKIEESSPWPDYAGADKDAVMSKLRENFVVDAWLANWDAPNNRENTRITPDGRAIRVDAGGAVMFRAQGDKRNLSLQVGELQSMLTMGGGRYMYAGLTHDEQIAGAERVLAISPDRIREMVKEHNMPSTIADQLIARRAYLATHYKLQLPENTPAGQKVLADLKQSQTLSPAVAIAQPAPAPAKIVTAIAPDAAAFKTVGSPVWVKNKRGNSFPDVGFISNVHPDGSVTIKSSKGNKEIEIDDPQDYELLRDNFASAASIYNTGQHVQLGDKINDKKDGDGVITEVYPLYARVTFDNGNERVIRVKNLARVALTGTFDYTPPAVTTSPLRSPQAATPLNIGPKADLSDAASFPKVVYSLPHRATVLILSYDATENKARVAVAFDNNTMKAANVPGDKLYDAEKINRDAVAAIPVRVPRVLGPRAATPLDVNTLPAKTFDFSGGVSDKLTPGDRIIKGKPNGTSQIYYLKIAKDGKVSVLGGNAQARKRGFLAYQNWNHTDNHLADSSANDPKLLSGIFEQVDEFTDVTPAKYDQAAAELGATKIDVSNLDTSAKLVWMKRHELPYGSSSTTSHEGESLPEAFLPTRTIGMDKDIKVHPGDVFTAYKDENSPVLGQVVKSSDYDYKLDPATGYYAKDKNGKNILVIKNVVREDFHKPKLFLTRNGKTFDVGYGGDNLEDPSKWHELTDTELSDFDLVKGLQSKYWNQYNYSATEPEVTLSTGHVVKWRDVNTYSGQNTGIGDANVKGTMLAGFIGNSKVAGPPQPYGARLTTGTSLIDYLKTHTQGWYKGDPNGAPDPADGSAPAAPGSGGISAQPAGVKDFNQLPGFAALTNTIDTNRKALVNGEYDDRLHEIMDTDYRPDATSRFGGRGLGKLPDGSLHADPYMAAFAQDHGGDAQTLAVNNVVFKAITEITGADPNNWRFVSDASQRDAIKDGVYFNGTGVNGNGSYSGRRSDATRYGSAGVQITPKPGFKEIKAADSWSQSTDDIHHAIVDRHNALASATDLPNMNDLRTLDLDDPENAVIVNQIMKTTRDQGSAIPNIGTATEQAAFDKRARDFAETTQGKAAVAYISAFRHAGWTATLSPLSTRDYRSTDEALTVLFADPHSKAAIRLQFRAPYKHRSRTTARLSTQEVTSETHFNINSLEATDPSGNRVDPPDHRAQTGQYASGWFFEEFTNMMDKSGAGEALVSAASINRKMADWYAAREKMSKLDSRISYISDPGRWALASGYDEIYVEFADFRVFLHRTAFIIKA